MSIYQSAALALPTRGAAGGHVLHVEAMPRPASDGARAAAYKFKLLDVIGY